MKDGLDYLGRARTQGLTLLLLTFLVGVLAGVAGDRILSRPQPQPPPPRPRGPGERPPLPAVLENMDLTAAQHAAIDSILATGRPRHQAILRTVLPQLRAVGDSLQQAIRAVLTPKQAAEFDAYLRSHRGATVAPPPRLDDAGGPQGNRPREEGPPEGGPPPPPRAGEHDRRPPPPPGEGPEGWRPPPPPPGGGPPPPPPDDSR